MIGFSDLANSGSRRKIAARWSCVVNIHENENQPKLINPPEIKPGLNCHAAFEMVLCDC